MANVNNLFVRIYQLNLNAKKVSDSTGISTGNLSDWKKGKCLPSAEKLETLADYLDCSVDYLLGRTDNPEVNRSIDTEIRLVAEKNISISLIDESEDIT